MFLAFNIVYCFNMVTDTKEKTIDEAYLKKIGIKEYELNCYKNMRANTWKKLCLAQDL